MRSKRETAISMLRNGSDYVKNDCSTNLYKIIVERIKENTLTIYSNKECVDTEISDDTLVFVSDAFSTYVLVTTIEDVTLASDGKNYKITVTYNKDANIPEDAELSVEEILESDDSSEYDTYIEKNQGSIEFGIQCFCLCAFL